VPRRPRFVATDLDGTLIRSDGTVSDRARRALRRVEASGSTVVLVTGRPTRVMADIVARTGATGLAICGNGAVLYDLDTRVVVEQRHLAAATALWLADTIRALVPGAAFAVESGLRFGREPAFLTHWPDPDELVGDLADLVAALPVTKLLVRVGGQPPAAQPGAAIGIKTASAAKGGSGWPAPLTEAWRVIAELARDDAVVTTSSVDMVEIAGVGVSKAAALDGVVRARGAGAADVIAFGDMPNDLPMLAWAGHAVAVANAHPEVLAAADEVTASNDEDGVAVVLERLYP
jgi:hydroxymethylpyrimidine pyrophosphatase-like HAD family hydrolase